MVQNVRMNPYFDISSKTQIWQKCHLRPCCIQPTIFDPGDLDMHLTQIVVKIIVFGVKMTTLYE